MERWIAIITQCSIRQDKFSNTKELQNRVEHFVKAYEKSNMPLSGPR